MFVGHLAVAFAAKRVAPAANIGWLMAGVTMLDLVWPVFVLAGIEYVRIVPGATAFTPLVFDSYPWSHSLFMSIVWGFVLAAVARACRVPAPAWLLVALVVSHWVLDAASHAPDMPLWPGPSPLIGLGLWYSIPLTIVAEGILWIAGLAIYLRARRPFTRSENAAFWSLVGVATLLWVTQPWSPPPPSVEALGWFGLIGWLIAPWAALAERRAPTSVPA
ncbi:MAG: hypothetical protein FJW14_03560 [Acidimicrobiia bacterium]|nr:hypothetical protein [Acidimicrobiia bacterium]